MFFNVAQLLQEPVGAERVYDVAGPVEGVVEDAAPSEVSGTVRLVRTNRGLLAYANLDGVLRDLCSRCLGPADLPVRIAVEEEFLPTVDVYTGKPLPPGDDEDGEVFRIDEHHHLDLTEAIRQALVTEQPMRPLCREECAGLCDTCGADRNAGACGCVAEPEDSPWAALRGLTINDNGKQ